MKIFIEHRYKSTGIARFVEGFSVVGHELVWINHIKECNNYKEESAIFAGMLPTELSQCYSIKRKYYVVCSPFGQADLSSSDLYSPEIQLIIITKRLVDGGEIAGVITVSKALASVMKWTYVPPVQTGIWDYVGEIQDRHNYGFLGNNGRKHKNVATQLAAISLLEPKESIIVSVSPEAYREFEKVFGIEVIGPSSRWSDEEYYTEIMGHRLGFQCSYSEAFNYIAFEYACMGVPCIVGPTIDWYPVEECKVKNVDSPIEIASVAQSILDCGTYRKNVCQFLKKWAKDFDKVNREEMKETLGKLQ